MKNNNFKRKIELKTLLDDASSDHIESFIEKNKNSSISDDMLKNIKAKTFEKTGIKTASEKETTKKKGKKIPMRRWFYAAACLILAFAVAIGVKYINFGNPPAISGDTSDGHESENNMSGGISTDKYMEETSGKDEPKILFDGKKAIGYDIKYPGGDYFPPELGTIEITRPLRDAFELYDDDEFFCVSVITRSKYEDLKKSLTYEGETYEDLYAKRENSVEDAERFSIIAKIFSEECKKRDVEFFKNNDIYVMDATVNTRADFHIVVTEKQLDSLEITNQQSYYFEFDNPEKWGEVEFEYELVIPSK
jgi:hypothetical protein